MVKHLIGQSLFLPIPFHPAGQDRAEAKRE